MVLLQDMAKPGPTGKIPTRPPVLRRVAVLLDVVCEALVLLAVPFQLRQNLRLDGVVLVLGRLAARDELIQQRQRLPELRPERVRLPQEIFP